MNWEEKFEIMQNITHTEIRMRKPSDWFVSSWMQTAGGNYGNGRTPEEAVNNHWDIITSYPVSINRTSGKEDEYFKWNGFMFTRTTKEDFLASQHDHLFGKRVII